MPSSRARLRARGDLEQKETSLFQNFIPELFLCREQIATKKNEEVKKSINARERERNNVVATRIGRENAGASRETTRAHLYKATKKARQLTATHVTDRLQLTDYPRDYQ